MDKKEQGHRAGVEWATKAKRADRSRLLKAWESVSPRDEHTFYHTPEGDAFNAAERTFKTIHGHMDRQDAREFWLTLTGAEDESLWEVVNDPEFLEGFYSGALETLSAEVA